jgi:hypothetical protein
LYDPGVSDSISLVFHFTVDGTWKHFRLPWVEGFTENLLADTYKLYVPDMAPEFVDTSFVVFENLPEAAVIGTTYAVDLTCDTVLTYHLIPGDWSDAFSIDSITGTISVADSARLDYETDPEIHLKVEASNSAASDTGIVNIRLLDHYQERNSAFGIIHEDVYGRIISYQGDSSFIYFELQSNFAEKLSFDVDVNQNGEIDEFVDRSYGGWLPYGICVQYLIDERGSTGCGVPFSGASLLVADTGHNVYKVPLCELYDETIGNTLHVNFYVRNLNTAWGFYFPERPDGHHFSSFSDIYELKILIDPPEIEDHEGKIYENTPADTPWAVFTYRDRSVPIPFSVTALYRGTSTELSGSTAPGRSLYPMLLQSIMRQIHNSSFCSR